MHLALVCTLLVMAARASNAANILGLLVIPSPSHHIWNRSLMRALAARGHKVTVLSPDEEKNPGPNYTQYVVPESYDYEIIEPTDMAGETPFAFVDTLNLWGIDVCKKTLSAGGTRKLMKLVNSTAFDVIIADVTSVDCQLGFVHAFNNPPLIGMTAYSHPMSASYMTGNPHNPAYVPELSIAFTDHMNFRQRLHNTLLHLYTLYMSEYSYMPTINRMVRECFGESVPAIQDIRSNASLVFVNTHVSFDHPRPVVPAVVEVGGMHIGPNETLPKHLKKAMDEATEGFIYFSLGSNIRSDKMPADRRKVFLQAFSKLPYRVFWKWESDSLPGQPSNVVVGKWMPQRDILAHPNILLFISHNGLLSTQEAIYNGVPIVGVPFYADQEINAVKGKAQGFAERIDYSTVTADQLLRTIKKVVNDPRYRENAKRVSELMKDQPQSPLERAVFWVEYVIRHKGGPHLRSAAADLPWYQYLLLDVMCVLAAAAVLVLLLLRKAAFAVASLLVRTGSADKHKKH